MKEKKSYINDDCWFCEGTKKHFGKACGACDDTGSDKVRKQLVKLYNAKNGLPIRANLNPIEK